MDYKKIALFLAGTLFGSAGLKILGSRDAKKAYANVTRAAIRAKDATLKAADEFLPEHCDYRDAEWLSEIQIDIHRQV